MKTFIIIMAPARSHLNASFELARKIKNDGNKVVYVGNGLFKELVLSQEFEYIALPHRFISGSEVILVTNRKRSLKSILLLLLRNMIDRLSDLRYNEFYFEINRFVESVQRLKPDFILLDSFIGWYYIFFSKTNIRFLLIQTSLSTYESSNIPPLNSAIIPNQSLLSKYWISIIWKVYYFKRALKRANYYVLFHGQDFYSLLKRKAKMDKIDLNAIIRSDKVFNPIGIKCVPELVIPPLALDFPWRRKLNNQHFIELATNLHRKDEQFEEAYLQAIKEVKKTKDSKFIFCSLGSVSNEHSSNCEYFYKKIISAISKRNDWNLLISIGSIMDKSLLGNISSNVFIFNFVPQLHVLQHCDVMINHGGTNSIIECVHSNVPMLVYPLNNIWDLNGNASRVVFHGLGIRGNINVDSESTIVSKLSQIFNSDEFKKNICAMKKKIIFSSNTDEFKKVLYDL